MGQNTGWMKRQYEDSRYLIEYHVTWNSILNLGVFQSIFSLLLEFSSCFSWINPEGIIFSLRFTINHHLYLFSSWNGICGYVWGLILFSQSLFCVDSSSLLTSFLRFSLWMYDPVSHLIRKLLRYGKAQSSAFRFVQRLIPKESFARIESSSSKINFQLNYRERIMLHFFLNLDELLSGEELMIWLIASEDGVKARRIFTWIFSYGDVFWQYKMGWEFGVVPLLFCLHSNPLFVV